MNVPTTKPEPTRPRLAQPLNPEGRCLGSMVGREALRDQPPAKYCKWCKAAGGPFTTHNTVECHMFDKEGKQLVKSTKPFDYLKKPCKKGGADSGQMAYLRK